MKSSDCRGYRKLIALTHFDTTDDDCVILISMEKIMKNMIFFINAVVIKCQFIGQSPYIKEKQNVGLVNVLLWNLSESTDVGCILLNISYLQRNLLQPQESTVIFVSQQMREVLNTQQLQCKQPKLNFPGLEQL